MNKDTNVEEKFTPAERFLAIVLSFLVALGLIYFVFYTIPATLQWIDHHVVTQEELNDETYTMRRDIQILAQAVCDLNLSKKNEVVTRSIATISESIIFCK